MKAIYVSDIAENAQVTGEFFVARKALLRSKSGSPYLALTLGDRSGNIEARVWEEAERVSAAFNEGDFVRVKARAEVFREAVQLAVTDLVRLEPAAVDLADFLPASERDPQEMLKELKALGRKVGNPHLRALLEAFFADRALMAGLARAAAAKNMHHAYLGGLLEHTLSVATLARDIAAHYPEVDRDLLLVGAVLHDIGKVRELSCAPGFDYTTEGRLVGHLLLGVEMLEEKMAKVPGFPPNLATALKHLIISHHGEYEFGSPKRPKTAEAFVLHALDDLDAKLNTVRQLLKSTASDAPAYHRVLERYIFGTLREGAAPPAQAKEIAHEGAREAEPAAEEANYSLLKGLVKGA